MSPDAERASPERAERIERARLAVTAGDEGERLDRFVVARLPQLSRSQAQKLITDGHVTLSEGQPKPALEVWDGLVVDVEIPGVSAAAPAAEAIPIGILYEDDDLAAIDKPAGLVVHPGAGHAAGTLVNALLHHLKGLSGIGGVERPGIVHRLDRGTSGVLVVAKTDAAHRSLSKQFQDRAVTKEYLALVWGSVRPGLTMTQPIGRDPRRRQKMSTRARRARSAETRVLEAEPLGGVSFVRVAIGTGRTHQIRVHLSEAGHPVVADELYGGGRHSVPPRLAPIARLKRPFLHAARLVFAQPTTGEIVDVEAPLAPDLSQVLDLLRRASMKPDKESRE
ncbi:MAG TPA: RluA family pseudouridine synthase [Vicinamibacterales bacterium]|nr:RluA family pseudouridine synthase [Vicinamibacterales bacterium]